MIIYFIEDLLLTIDLKLTWRNNQINKEYTVENRRVVNQENNQATNSFISLFSSNSDSFTKLQEQRPKKKKRNRRLWFQYSDQYI